MFWQHVVWSMTCQAWSKASELAQAYDLGRAESQAALFLMNEVEPVIVEGLGDLVRWEIVASSARHVKR